MKVLHINNFIRSGAGTSAFRLHQGLLQKNIESSYLHIGAENNFSERTFGYYSLLRKFNFYKKISQKLKQKKIGGYKEKIFKGKIICNEPFSIPYAPYKNDSIKLFKEADIIHFHNIVDFVDIKQVGLKNKKIVWTLHDQNPYTGGCHYSEGCLKFTSNCDICPQLKGTQNEKLSQLFQAVKNDKISSIINDLAIVSPSKWMFECAKSSTIFKKCSHHLIPYGLDTTTFKPYPQVEIRNELGLPLDKKILLFVSDHVHNKRKGLNFLMDAVIKISDKNIFLCTVGKSPDFLKDLEIPFKDFGYISDPNRIAKIYNAADLYIHTALEDNLPNTVLEALSSGIPVVAFKTGGLSDLVISGFNGLLVEIKNVEELSNQISSLLLNDELRSQMKTNARITSENNYKLAIQAERYIDLYQSLLN